MEPFSSACRLCLWKGDKMIDVFRCNQKHSILDKIHKCIPIKFQKSDVTHVICHNCYYKLEIFAEFLTVCSRSDAILKRYIESQTASANDESAEYPDLTVVTVPDSSDDGMTEDEDTHSVNRNRLENIKTNANTATKREIPRLTETSEVLAALKNAGQLSEKTELTNEQSKQLQKPAKPKPVQLVSDQTINKAQQTVQVSEPARQVVKQPQKVKRQVNEVPVSGQDKQTSAQDRPPTAQSVSPDKQGAHLEKHDSVQDKQVTPQKKSAAAQDKQVTAQNKQLTAAEKQSPVQDKQTTPQKKQSAPQDKQAAAQNKQTSPPDKTVTAVQDKQIAPQKKQVVAQDKEITTDKQSHVSSDKQAAVQVKQISSDKQATVQVKQITPDKQATVQAKQISPDKQATVQDKQVPVQKKPVAVQDKQITTTDKQVVVQDKQVLPQKKQAATPDKQVSQDKQVIVPDKQLTAQVKQIAAQDYEMIGKDKRESILEKQLKSQWKEIRDKQVAEELKNLLEQEKAAASLITSKPKLPSPTVRHSPRLYNEYTRQDSMVYGNASAPSTSSSLRSGKQVKGEAQIRSGKLQFGVNRVFPQTNGNLNPATDVGVTRNLSDSVDSLLGREEDLMNNLENLNGKTPMVRLNRVNVCSVCGSAFFSEEDLQRHLASACSTRKRKRWQKKKKFYGSKTSKQRKRTRSSWVNTALTNMSPDKPETLTLFESLGLVKKSLESSF